MNNNSGYEGDLEIALIPESFLTDIMHEELDGNGVLAENANAQAEANRKLAESLSDTLIDYQKIQKWDGKLPTVSGGNALVSIDPAE